MVAEASGWGLLGSIAIFIVFVVLARALAPLIRSLGLVIGLIGTVVALVAAALALGAVILANLAGWAGWNEPSVPPGVSAHAAPLPFAMIALGAALAGALIALALFAHRRGKQN